MIATDMSAETRALADLLNAVPRGQIMSLGAIERATGKTIERCRSTLYSAMRVAERETGAVFACERRAGYRRLTPEEIVRIGQTARARIRGTARRGARSIAAGIAGANEIEPAAYRKILAEQSSLGLLEQIARDKNIVQVPEATDKPLPVALAGQEFLRIIGARG